MEPIIYRSDDFPIELTRANAYIAFHVGWNDGVQKFNVYEQRSFGWNTNNTTSGAYATFAEAYAAAEAAARELCTGSTGIAILSKEDNAQDLIGSWGMSKVQTAELETYLPKEPEKATSTTEPYWSEVRADFFETEQDTMGAGEEGAKLAQITIDAWKTPDENEQGQVIARVLLSDRGDILVDYHDNVARIDPMAQEAIIEAKRKLAEYHHELTHGKDTSREIPDELVVRLAHYAGEMEAKKQIQSPQWDDLCAAIRDAMSLYYETPSETNPFHIEDVAEKVFLTRFPAGDKGQQPALSDHIDLGDGTTVRASFSEGHVTAHGQDQRTWQSLDIQRYAPDGTVMDSLCCIDYEADLGLRTIIYNKAGDEDPVFAYRHALSSVKTHSLSSIIKEAENRKDTPEPIHNQQRKEKLYE